jgi:nucleoside-diphosphate-sugar epimerase
MTLAELMVADPSLPKPKGHGAPELATRFAGEAFNFSYGLRLTVKDVVQKILTAMNRKDLEPQILNQASNEIPVQCLNSDKAKTQLNWKPKYGFDEGVKMTVEWYQKLL